MTDQWVDELFDETENFMTFLRQHLKKLLSGATYYTPPPLAVNSVLPVISGTAVVGGTLTITPGTWSNNPIDYDRVLQIATDSPNFVQWTDIPDSKVLSYIAQSEDIDGKIRPGERALTLGGWSGWVFGDPTGIVVASGAPGSAPTINTPAYFTDVGGGAVPSPLYVGDTIEIQAPDVSDETGWWLYLVRDGVPVTIQPIATDQDTFPLAYALTSEDQTTTFELQTVASNAAGSVNDLSADIGPIAWPTGTGSWIDLGSRQETEDFILANAPAEWDISGSPTHTYTANNATDLRNYFNGTVKTGPLTNRYEISCNWDGASAYINELTTSISLQGPAGTEGWADHGGWVHIKASAGKTPSIANRVVMNNCRGLKVTGVNFAGKYSGSGQSTGQYCIWVQRNGTFNAPGKITLKNCGVGRYFIDNTEVHTNFINGIVFAGGMCDQFALDGSAVHGANLGIKGPCRLFITRNSDHTKPKIDFMAFREYVETGFYSYIIADGSTIRQNLTDYDYRTVHKDCIQTGRTPNTQLNADVHLGYRVVIKNCVWHAEHFYAGSSSAGGGSQGNYNDDMWTADNLYALYNNVILCTTVHAFAFHSPYGQYTSYVENCTFGRAGRIASGFSPDTVVPKEYSPGFTMLNWTNTTGIGCKVINSLIGCKHDAQRGYIAAHVQFSGTTVVNYLAADHTADPVFGIGASDPSPEEVFNGRDFTRGGAAEANSMPNKFGYILPNEATQAGFVSDIAANFTAQGAYAGLGATITPANYTSVTPPSGGG